MSTCSFPLKTGKNKGEKCGAKVFQNGEFCKRHSPKNETTTGTTNEPATTENEENSNESPKLVKSKEKVTKEKKEKKEPCKSKKPVIKEEPSINYKIYETFKLSAKRNQYGNYVLENDLVVEPGPDRIIIGRQFEDKIIDISIEDIEFCKIHSLMYKEPVNMYFRNNETEKVEMKLQKELLKELKKKDEQETQDEEIEDEDDDNSDTEENDNTEL